VPTGTTEEDRRIDFLCVSEGHNLIVVEIKRPQSRASRKELDQMREVVGYLLCGDVVRTRVIAQQEKSLERDRIYVRRYHDLLGMAKDLHKDFLERYDRLQAVKVQVAQAELAVGDAII